MCSCKMEYPCEGEPPQLERPVPKIRKLLRPSMHVCIQASSEKTIYLRALLATLPSPPSWCSRCKPAAIPEIQQRSTDNFQNNKSPT